MTSHLADLIKNVDPVDSLRLLVADTQTLADRLGLKERSRSLQQTLKSTQERVFGPHAVVLLLAEETPLKRRFLERLLGSNLKHVPAAIAACTRLEYGSEAECTVTMPQGLTAVLPLEQLADFLERRSVGMPGQVMQGVRLPNSTLARGLAVIDTPPIQEDSTTPCVLESAAQTDAWVFVLDADHALSAASQSVIRQLPEGAARLEIVIEGAETLSGEARLAARDRLVAVLRDQCGIPEPRLTLVASANAEGEENSFWHGRFATFHSVLMLRGRERWLESTRSVVADTLAEVNAEIEFELRTTGLGLRQARLRMGLKELEELRDRFFELGRQDSERPRETESPALADSWAQPSALRTTVSLPAVTRSAAADDATAIPPAPMGEPTFVKFREQDPEMGSLPPPPSGPTPRRGIAVHLNEDITRLLRSLKRSQMSSRGDDDERAATLPWRIAGAALVACFLCLVGWVVWPRMHSPGREPATQWNYQPTPGAAATSAAGTAAPGSVTSKTEAGLPPPVEAHAGPDTAGGEAINSAASPSPAAPGTSTHIPLSRPVAMLPQARRSHKRRHGLLGLGRVWHWIRHPGGGGSNEPETER